MSTDRETLRHSLPTATAVLAGVGGWNRHHATASVCGFACEDGAELGPTRIVNRLVETSLGAGPITQRAALAVGLGGRTTTQVGYLQVFAIENSVCSHQMERRLVVTVGPLPAHLLMPLGQQLYGLPAALAAFLAPRHPALSFLEGLLRPAVVPRVLHHIAFSGDEKHLQPHITTSPPVSRPVGGRGCAGTSAHEKQQYHPSASWVIVTVLTVP